MGHVIVVGAGMGGLAAAIELRGLGHDVTLLERAGAPGGKASTVLVAGARVETGPTVLTMRWVFDEIFRRAGRSLDDYVHVEPTRIIARHAWSDGSHLDLVADVEENARAIASFANRAEAERYRDFAVRARETYDAARTTFIESPKPTLGSFFTSGPVDFRKLAALDPARTMWRALSQHFRDRRLRQLFSRYATYCGASPFEAPATFNLIAHVEALGVHRVRGGVSALAAALSRCAGELGVDLRFGACVDEIVVEGSVAKGVRCGGETIRADAVLVNADVATLAGGAFGDRAARSVSRPGPRSLSAITWAIVGRARGFSAAHHTVFFSDDYASEFDDLIRRERAPLTPTIYVCAQDRVGEERQTGDERFLVVMNAPATGDDPARWTETERRRCERAAFETMTKCGFVLEPRASVMTTPVELAARFPGTGGAIYGPRATGAFSMFRREGSKTSVSGLYLAGGSVHPGPGVPMAATSGSIAAMQIAADLRSIAPSRTAGIDGTISMGSAMTARSRSS